MQPQSPSKKRFALLFTLIFGGAFCDKKDGIPSADDTRLFDALFQKALHDRTMIQQRSDLLAYAEQQIQQNRDVIATNFFQNSNTYVKGFDLLWPGNGFNGVGYGGVFVVLDSLGLAGKRMGVSGGAASAILSCAGMDKFLALYQTYQLFYEGWSVVDGTTTQSGGLADARSRAEILGDTLFSSAVYLEAVRAEDAWAETSEIIIVGACGWWGAVGAQAGIGNANVGFRGFSTKNQFVAAGYASGNASIQGFLTTGTRVPAPTGDMREDFGYPGYACGDGGAVTLFPPGAATREFGLLQYFTRDESMGKPTAASIQKLFRDGVDDTIGFLRNGARTESWPETGDEEDGDGGRSVRLAVARPDAAGHVGAESFRMAMGYEPKPIVDANYA